MSATERIAAWLAEHRKLRYSLRLLTVTHVLCLWSLLTAPNAAADAGGAVLAWTGLRDADGVPLQFYFLSVVDTLEAVTNNGQEVDLLDPQTLLAWAAKAMQTAVTHSTAAWWLTAEASAMVAIIGISFWFLRFAMSSSWLLALAQIGRPVFAAVNTLVHQMWLGPLAAAVCITVAGYHYQGGRPGRAWNIVGTAVLMTLGLWLLFKDPIDELVSDHGILGMGRATGFQIAQAARNGSYAPGQSTQAQLDGLLSQLISATARPALQLQNFGMVVDDIGTCRRAWSQAIIAGAGHGGPGPAYAMAHCGAPQALTYAQHLGGYEFFLGLFLIVIAGLISLFIWYVGISTLLVGAKATYYGIVVGPAILLGMTGWQRGKNYAIRAASQIFLHAAEMIIYTTFLAITAVAMGWTLTTPTLGHGGSTLIPRMLIVGLGSIVAILLFHYIDKHFYTDGLGTIGHQISGVWRSARTSAGSDYDDFTDNLAKLRSGHDRLRKWRSGNDTGDDVDKDLNPQLEDGSGFDVVKPRPVGQSARGPATTKTSSVNSAGSTVTGEATVVGESSEVGAAAGTAAEVAVPEVAVPVAVAAAAAHHLHNRHQAQSEPPPQGMNSQSGTPPPDPVGSSPGRSSDGALNDAALPAIAPRPGTASRRTMQPPRLPNAAATPPISTTGDDDPDIATPLEVSPAPATRPTNPTYRES